MLVDFIIIILAIASIFRGREIGFVRQLFSASGFFIGLFIGALLEPHTISLAQTATARSVIALATTMGCALILLTIGEYVGVALKHKVLLKPINSYDNGLGAALSVVTLLVSIWLSAAILSSIPLTGLQTAVKDSRVIGYLNRELPSAPSLVEDFGHLIDPNGFPDVFIGGEPAPGQNLPLPNLGDLQTAVANDKNSVVKVEGRGCGGIVEGSGFVVGAGLVATNAHVVAGIAKPYVQDSTGTHSAEAIWFDPNLDFAVLRVPNLAGHSLVLSTRHNSPGTPAAVLGYPGGGPFTAGAAVIQDEFTATGRNIYGKSSTSRDIYEVQANIIPGNSGGPLVAKDGAVIGIVFAESTTYNHIGYALTTAQVSAELAQAEANNDTVNTGKCAQ